MLALAALGLSITTGCSIGERPMPAHVQHYRISAQLTPETNELAGRTTLTITKDQAAELPESGYTYVEFELHADLEVTGVQAGGVDVVGFQDVTEELAGPHGKTDAVSANEEADDEATEGGEEADEDTAPQMPPDHPKVPGTRTYRVVLDEPVDALTLTVMYTGTLYQDASAGEKMGQIHNFTMRAHVGEDGVYLVGGPWYPVLKRAEESAPTTAEYELLVNSPEGIALQAGGEEAPDLAESTGWDQAWRSPFPLDGMVLVGGPHQVFSRQHGDLNVSVHLSDERARHADGLLTMLCGFLDRYEPLLGPFPTSEFSIVENFFSSGFAFPAFTLMTGVLFDMGPRAYNRHGMYDHELLHSYWGNGVLVDPRDGNWCESITSYATNYYGYVLDGDEEGARRKRRNDTHFTSRINPAKEKALGTYDQPDGCSRGIAYNKGAMVFHMLARKIGQEEFWLGIRKFNREHMGRYADWADIQRAFEEVSGQDLTTFFEQWVRRPGCPTLAVRSAVYDSAAQTLTITIEQGDPAFEIDVPIRVTHNEGVVDLLFPMQAKVHEGTFSLASHPLTVEADPDYHIFRRVGTRDIIPTTACTRRGDQFAAVLPAGEMPKKFAMVQRYFEGAFEDEERLVLTAGEGSVEGLVNRSTLVLGEAVRDPKIAGFLSGIDFPVQWTEDGFVYEGTEYNDPADAVMCTVHHPAVEGGGVTVLYANSEAAIPSPAGIPMYPYSLVIFKNGQRVDFADFERKLIVPVEVR
jgi:aminopeptidase N